MGKGEILMASHHFGRNFSRIGCEKAASFNIGQNLSIATVEFSETERAKF